MDKIAFAQLIGYISSNMATPMERHKIEYVESLIASSVTVQKPVMADAGMINYMLKSIKANQKIEAIKAYRSLTGYGLKESKDAIEAHWPNKPADYAAIKTTLINAFRSNAGDKLDLTAAGWAKLEDIIVNMKFD